MSAHVCQIKRCGCKEMIISRTPVNKIEKFCSSDVRCGKEVLLADVKYYWQFLGKFMFLLVVTCAMAHHFVADNAIYMGDMVHIEVSGTKA